MYKPHGECKPPSDPNVSIWRYLDFAKFVDLLDQRQLHFARLDQLGDPFEGAPSDGTIALARRWEELHPISTATGEPFSEISARETYRLNSVCAYVNCWHMNEHESLAMWRLYSRDGLGIRSTYQHLVESLACTDINIYIGQVFYRDHRHPAHAENWGNGLAPVLRKGMSYAYERELRAVVMQHPDYWKSGLFPLEQAKETQPKGIDVNVDLDVLLDRVYVAPQRPAWFKALVERVLAKYEIETPVETSRLDERPDLA